MRKRAGRATRIRSTRRRGRPRYRVTSLASTRNPVYDFACRALIEART